MKVMAQIPRHARVKNVALARKPAAHPLKENMLFIIDFPF